MDSKYLTPRKQMAMGDRSAGAMIPVEGGMIAHPDANMDTGKTLAEPNRGIPAPKLRGGNMMAEPQPADHGPHRHAMGRVR